MTRPEADGILLALDFGGTKHAAALLRASDLAHAGVLAWLAYERHLSPPGADAQTDLALVLGMAREMLGTHPGELAAVGVSFGGPVDAPRGRVRLSHHVPGWEDFPLAERLQAELGAPVSVDNDANAGALGEWRFGAGRGCDSLLYITVSTGVGGGWVLDGRPYRGADGMAGEIGHTVVRPARSSDAATTGSPMCVCGRAGCVEVLACGPAIARHARERLAADSNAGQRLRNLVQGRLDRLTAEHVCRAAQAGDALALDVLLDAAEALGAGIGNALSLMNPRRVVLGGGVAQAGDAYWAEVRRAARANTLPEISVDIVPAALGGDAPLWGAVVQCVHNWQHIGGTQ